MLIRVDGEEHARLILLAVCWIIVQAVCRKAFLWVGVLARHMFLLALETALCSFCACLSLFVRLSVCTYHTCISLFPPTSKTACSRAFASVLRFMKKPNVGT